MAKPDGGAAFPEPFVISEDRDGYKEAVAASEYGFGGMKLRDWFAGQALIGLMGDPGLRPSSVEEFENMAHRLYQVADAMLAEREKD